MAHKKKNETTLEEKINNIVDNIIDWFKNLFSGKKGADEILNIFLTIIVMLLLLWLLKIPFIILSSLGKSLIIFTFTPLDRVLIGMWEVVIQLAYLVFAIFIIVTIFKKIFNTKHMEDRHEDNEEKIIKEEKGNNIDIYATIKIAGKILIAILMIPFILFNIGLFILLGVLIGLWIKGTLLVGAIFITVGIFLIMSSIMGIVLRLLSEGEKRK